MPKVMGGLGPEVREKNGQLEAANSWWGRTLWELMKQSGSGFQTNQFGNPYQFVSIKFFLENLSMILLKTLRMVILSSQGRGTRSASSGSYLSFWKGPDTYCQLWELYCWNHSALPLYPRGSHSWPVTNDRYPYVFQQIFKETAIWLSCIFYVLWNILFLLVFFKIYLKIQKSFLAHRPCSNRLQWIWAMTCNLPASNFCHWLWSKALHLLQIGTDVVSTAELPW